MGNRGTLSFLSLSVPCPTVHQPFVLARLLTRLRSRRRNAAELQRVDRDENPGAATGGTHHLIEPVVATSTLSVLASGSPTRPLEREWRPKCNLVSAWRMVDPGTPLIRPETQERLLAVGKPAVGGPESDIGAQAVQDVRAATTNDGDPRTEPLPQVAVVGRTAQSRMVRTVLTLV